MVRYSMTLYFCHYSLNQLQRQREMERVAKENKEMLKRLEKVEPIYKVSDWIEDWRRKEEITGMITAYPDDFQAIVSVLYNFPIMELVFNVVHQLLYS